MDTQSEMNSGDMPATPTPPNASKPVERAQTNPSSLVDSPTEVGIEAAMGTQLPSHARSRGGANHQSSLPRKTAAWDLATEDDEILSYFLGADDNDSAEASRLHSEHQNDMRPIQYQHPPALMHGPAVSKTQPLTCHLGISRATPLVSSIDEQSALQHSTMTGLETALGPGPTRSDVQRIGRNESGNFIQYHANSVLNARGSADDDSDDDADGRKNGKIAPSTPAIQYYHTTSTAVARAMPSGSSSIASMAAARSSDSLQNRSATGKLHHLYAPNPEARYHRQPHLARMSQAVQPSSSKLQNTSTFTSRSSTAPIFPSSIPFLGTISAERSTNFVQNQTTTQQPYKDEKMVSRDSFQSINGLTPISPAADLGPVEETLMLPISPPSQPTQSSKSGGSHGHMTGGSSFSPPAKHPPTVFASHASQTQTNAVREESAGDDQRLVAPSSSKTDAVNHMDMSLLHATSSAETIQPQRIRAPSLPQPAPVVTHPIATMYDATATSHSQPTIGNYQSSYQPNIQTSAFATSSATASTPTSTSAQTSAGITTAAPTNGQHMPGTAFTTGRMAQANLTGVIGQTTNVVSKTSTSFPQTHVQNPFFFVPTHHSAAAAAAAAALNQLNHKAASSLLASASSSNAVESEEKRAKRLERNRESARKSRRRKKERLFKLEQQVDALYQELEMERRQSIKVMNSSLTALRLALFGKRAQISELESEPEARSHSCTGAPGQPSTAVMEQQSLTSKIVDNGFNCPVRRAVIDFQWNALNRAVLQTHQRFLLWVTLQQESYFVAGKLAHVEEERQKTEGGSSAGGKSGGLNPINTKVSSKQIGDEIANGPKAERKAKPSSDGRSNGKKKQTAGTRSKPAIQSASAFDSAKMWPMTCFELSISVDQEERMVSTTEKLQRQPSTKSQRSKIATAIRMIHCLKHAILFQSYTGSLKQDHIFLQVLTPRQAVRYHDWYAKNGGGLMAKRSDEASTQSSATTRRDVSCTNDLSEISRHLEEVLQISQPDDTLDSTFSFDTA